MSENKCTCVSVPSRILVAHRVFLRFHRAFLWFGGRRPSTQVCEFHRLSGVIHFRFELVELRLRLLRQHYEIPPTVSESLLHHLTPRLPCGCAG